MKTKINRIQNLKCFYAWKILMKTFYTLYGHWNFCLKMFAAVFHFFFPCSYNFNIILSEEYTKINKIEKASSNCIFTLKILPTDWTTMAANILISLQNTCMSWQNHARCSSLSTTYTESLFFKRESNFLSLLWENSILLDRKQFSLFIIVTWHIIQHDSWT